MITKEGGGALEAASDPAGRLQDLLDRASNEYVDRVGGGPKAVPSPVGPGVDPVPLQNRALPVVQRRARPGRGRRTTSQCGRGYLASSSVARRTLARAAA